MDAPQRPPNDLNWRKLYTDAKARVAKRSNVCSACGTTAEKVQVCGKCMMPQYCSKECQKKDWETHKFQCIKTHALSLGIFDILDDAEKGIASAQVVMGILYLRGYDFKVKNDDSLKEIKELAAQDNVYANQALGAIYLNKGLIWHQKAQPYLLRAASAGMQQAGAMCCGKMKELIDDPKCFFKEAVEDDFYRTYRVRFSNIPRMTMGFHMLTQEIEFKSLLERLEKKMPREEQKAINLLRLKFYQAAEEQALKGKEGNVHLILSDINLLSIKPVKAIAKHFLTLAAAQKERKAEQLLSEVIILDEKKKS